jgi:hypothetical protein
MTTTEDQIFLTFDQTAQRFPIFSLRALRQMRFANTNNFNSCVRRIGRKVVINVPSFLTWLDNQQDSKNL